MYLSFAWRYFKAKKSANAINIIAWVTTAVIAFATCCQVLVLSVFNGFEDLVKSLYSSFYTDLKIVPATGKTFVFTPQQYQLVQQQPFVAGTSMIIQEKALAQNGDENQTGVTLKGVDSNYAKVSGLPSKISNGKFNVGNIEQPGLVVGYGIQNALNIMVDEAFAPDELTLILPKRTEPGADPSSSISQGLANANGVFAIQQEFDNGYIITNIDFMRQQLGLASNEYSAAEIKLKYGEDIEERKADLQKLLGKNVIVQSRYQQNMSLYNTMRLEKWAIYAVLTLILIIAAFNMVSALTMLVLEKQKDISILQSMGGSKAFIRKIFLSEGLLLGSIGAACGICLAVIICLLQLKFKLIKLQGGSFLIDYFPVKLIAGDFLLVAGTAAAIALIASWAPAVKASKQSIELK